MYKMNKLIIKNIQKELSVSIIYVREERTDKNYMKIRS